jgi:hypothetical protein
MVAFLQHGYPHPKIETACKDVTKPQFSGCAGHVETYLDFGGLRGETVWGSLPTCHGSPDGTGAAAVVRKAQKFSSGAVHSNRGANFLGACRASRIV